MSPDKMRRLDRWIGIPLCAIVSVFARLVRLIRGNRAPPPVQRILFVGLAEIGALVLAHPAVTLARRRHPDAEIYFASFDQGQPMLTMMGFDDAHRLVISARSMGSLIIDTLRFILHCRRLGIDSTVNLEVYARYSTLLCYLSGARRRAGFYNFFEEGGYVGGALLTHKIVYSPHHHITTSYCAVVAALADESARAPLARTAPADWPRTRLVLPRRPEDHASVTQKLQAAFPGYAPAHHRLVLLNANCSDLVGARRWPLENYVALAGAILARVPDVRIILTGSGGERAHVDSVCRQIGDPRCASLAGATSLHELIALFQQGALLITNDSGPAHFASTSDIPTLVLFGPETPRIFGPIGPDQRALYLGLACSPCISVYNQKRSPCGENLCMSGISVDMVLTAAAEILGRNRAAIV